MYQCYHQYGIMRVSAMITNICSFMFLLLELLVFVLHHIYPARF